MENTLIATYSTTLALIAFVATSLAFVGGGRFRRAIGKEVDSKEAELSRAIDGKAESLFRRIEEQSLEGELNIPESLVPENHPKTLRRALEGLSKSEATEGVLTARTTALIDVYHRQGLVQYQVSFWFSIILATLGFGVIAYAVIFIEGSLAPVISGVVTEAVAALFFTQSNQSRRVITSYMDKLREDRRFQTALQLAADIPDHGLRSALQAVLALEIMDAKTHPSTLPGFNIRTNLRVEETEA